MEKIKINTNNCFCKGSPVFIISWQLEGVIVDIANHGNFEEYIVYIPNKKISCTSVRGQIDLISQLSLQTTLLEWEEKGFLLNGYLIY